LNTSATSPARIPSSAVKRRLIVVGCSHAGAELARQLLAGQPGVHDIRAQATAASGASVAPEHDLFSALQGRRGPARLGASLGVAPVAQRRALRQVLAAAGDASAAPPPLPPRALRRDTAYADAIATLDRLTLAAGCRSWVEQTTAPGVSPRALGRRVPRAHLIHVVRDGRDVLAAQCVGVAHRRGGYCRRGDARRSVARWNRALEAHRRCLQCSGHSFVFYEDLLTHPMRELTRLIAECGLELDADAAAAVTRHSGAARADRARFRELFESGRRRRIEAALHLREYGELAERLRHQALSRPRPPASTPEDGRHRVAAGLGG
jgi:hypothetical protein